jgi:hypothetical protein
MHAGDAGTPALKPTDLLSTAASPSGILSYCTTFHFRTPEIPGGFPLQVNLAWTLKTVSQILAERRNTTGELSFICNGRSLPETVPIFKVPDLDDIIDVISSPYRFILPDGSVIPRTLPPETRLCDVEAHFTLAPDSRRLGWSDDPTGEFPELAFGTGTVWFEYSRPIGDTAQELTVDFGSVLLGSHMGQTKPVRVPGGATFLEIERLFSAEFKLQLEIDRGHFLVSADAAPDLKALRPFAIPLVKATRTFVTVITKLPDQREERHRFFSQTTIGELKALICPERPLHGIDVFVGGSIQPDSLSLAGFPGACFEFRFVDRYSFVVDGNHPSLTLAQNEQTFDTVICRLHLSDDVVFFRNGRRLRALGPPRHGEIEIRRPAAPAAALRWTIACRPVSNPPCFDFSFADCISSFALDTEATVSDLIECFSGATGVLFPPFALFAEERVLDDQSVKIADLHSHTFSVRVPDGVGCRHLRVRHPIGDTTSEFITVGQAPLRVEDVWAHLAARYALKNPFTLARYGTVLFDGDEIDPLITEPVWLLGPIE